MSSTPPPPPPRLPAELRNKIYAYVFATPFPWDLAFRSTTVTCTPSPSSSSTQRLSTYLALTQTCRQIRSETYLMPRERCVWRLGDRSLTSS